MDRGCGARRQECPLPFVSAPATDANDSSRRRLQSAPAGSGILPYTGPGELRFAGRELKWEQSWPWVAADKRSQGLRWAERTGPFADGQLISAPGLLLIRVHPGRQSQPGQSAATEIGRVASGGCCRLGAGRVMISDRQSDANNTPTGRELTSRGAPKIRFIR